ncbi:unnamed protein product [Caenorhabditis nigoni]
MRLLLTTLLILYNLPLTNATSIYEFSQPEYRIGKNHNVQIWQEPGVPDLNRTDIRFLFHSSKFGFKNPNFIRNVSEFLLMDNSFSTFNLISDATDDILENSENFSNFSQQPTLWIIDFQSRNYAEIFPQFDVRDLSCDKFGSVGKFRKNRYFQNFDLLLLETNSPCGQKIHKKISKKWDFILQILALKWKFYDIIILETDKTTNYTYSPYPEYREELSNLENMKRQRYFQNIYIDALHEMSRDWSDFLTKISDTEDGVSMDLVDCLVIALPPFRWIRRRNRTHRFNIFYPLRNVFYFMISRFADPNGPKPLLSVPLIFNILYIRLYVLALRNKRHFWRQLIVLEIIYKLSKYIVDDTRKVIWPFILANEIFDLKNVFKYRTTQYLTFELQVWKTIETFQYFILLNQYPDFYILIWLLGIFALQLFSFSLYFRYPPLTWTVPVFDIAPIFGRKNRYMIYTRYVAIGLVFVTFGLYWEQLGPKL